MRRFPPPEPHYLATMHLHPDLPRRRGTLLLPVALCLLTACTGAGAGPTPAPTVLPAVRDTAPGAVGATAPVAVPPAVPAIFGEFASRMVMVFPLQRYAVGDSGWISAASATGRPRAAQLDSALTLALRERGLDGTWSLPPNTSRVAQREVMNRTDPRSLSTAGLVPSRRPNDRDLRDLLASQLRNLVAMVPEARIVMLPLEARVIATASGSRQATLRLAFIDARMATVLTFPDVIGPPAADEAAALRGVALKFADLVIAP